MAHAQAAALIINNVYQNNIDALGDRHSLAAGDRYASQK
jgi:hypothetical protein